ncbi:MAG: hypothetical protein QME68_00180, partial [Elusimicrobiota bacterium]|nr:hypothetical protein [Elusimicrobiota bacterium]
CLYAAFRYLPTHTRPLALGGAFVAVTNDTNNIIYNPAGLGDIRMKEIDTTYGKLFAGLDGVNIHNCLLTFALPIKNNFGIGILYSSLNTDNIYEENIFFSFLRI